MSTRFEDSQILIKHAEFILATLEKHAAKFRDDGEISKLFQTSEGLKLQDFASSYVRAIQTNATLPRCPTNLTMLQEKINMMMIEPTQMIDYAVNWCNRTAFQLKQLTRVSRDFDIRWNLQITTTACTLFTNFCKVCLYLHQIPQYLFCVHLFSSSPLAQSMQLLSRFEDILNFVTGCHKNPLEFIYGKLDFLKDKLSLMVVTLLPFFSTLFADWTVFNWALLSVYETPPSKTQGEYSMPIDDFIILSNLPLFQETMTLFTLVFSEFLDKNQQFAQLGCAVLTESPVFYLSRCNSIRIENLISLVKHSATLVHLKSDLAKRIDLKVRDTHLHRMEQLVFFGGDIANLAEISPEDFLKCLEQAKAVFGFAFYEINLFLRLNDLNCLTEKHISTASELIHLIVQIGSWFVNNKTLIERFFVFNLATLDADYLESMLSSIDIKIGKAGGEMIKIGQCIHRSLCDIDLKTYDEGKRYDFNILLMTHGRTLYKYNENSMKIRTTFLNPIFEHLQTIVTHAQGAQDSVLFFLESCPFHKLWPYTKQIMQLINYQTFPLNYGGAIFNLFTFFNYDKVIISMHLGAIDTVKSSFDKIRGKVGSRLTSLMNEILNKESSHIKYCCGIEIGYSLPDDRTFDVEYGLEKDSNAYNSRLIADSKKTQIISEANDFLKTIPQSIKLFGEVLPITDYVLSRLTDDLIQIMLFNSLNNPTVIQCCSQIIWTFFTQFNLAFFDSFFKKIAANTTFAGINFSDQLNALLKNGSLAPSNTPDTRRLIYQIGQEILHFANNGHEQTKYTNFLQKFIGEIKSYSPNYFLSILRNIGIHGGLYLDTILIKNIVKEITDLLVIFYATGTGPIKSEVLIQASESLLKLSSSLVMRNIIRKSLTDFIEETTPGLINLLDQFEFPPDKIPEKHLIEELINTKDGIYFIQEPLRVIVAGKNVSLKDFFVFLAQLFGNPQWNDVKFFGKENALSRNLHLLPTAVGLFLKLMPILFEKMTEEDSTLAVKAFFETMLYKVMDEKKNNPNAFDCFLILMDMFPKMAPNINYGMISPYFPYSRVTWCYPTTKQ